jgi:hypothetical protein
MHVMYGVFQLQPDIIRKNSSYVKLNPRGKKPVSEV